MPKSRVRKKKVYTPPTDVRPAVGAKKKKPSPRWVPIVAVALIVIGIGYLVMYYMTRASTRSRRSSTGTSPSASACWSAAWAY